MSASALASVLNRNYSRDEYVYLARLYERAERFDDMVKFINKFVEMRPTLSNDERILLSIGYKNVISKRRSSWRLLHSLEKKEDKMSPQLQYIRSEKAIIENELTTICNEIQHVVDKYLVPNAKDALTKVFFLKLKGDYYRYKCEYTVGKEFENDTALAEKAYKDAYAIAEKDIAITDSTRLGLALNFSVFYYEIKNMKEEALNIAKNAFNEAMKVLDDLEKSKAKDTLLIIQLLKENMILWSNESEEEGN